MDVPNLEYFRKQAFLSQGELAKKAGVDVSTIKRLERKETTARYSTIRKLAAALGVEPAALVEEQGKLAI